MLEQGSSHWTRRFVVVRRPYLLFYRSARDPIERSIINLSTAVVEYSADKQVNCLFTVNIINYEGKCPNRHCENKC